MFAPTKIRVVLPFLPSYHSPTPSVFKLFISSPFLSQFIAQVNYYMQLSCANSKLQNAFLLSLLQINTFQVSTFYFKLAKISALDFGIYGLSFAIPLGEYISLLTITVSAAKGNIKMLLS